MNLAPYIEHTLLKPDLQPAALEQLVQEAIENKFVGVCVPPYWVKFVKRLLGEEELALVTVVGFPLGYSRTESKLREIELALKDGATEIDLVMNLSAFRTNAHWAKVEFARAASLCHEGGAMLKVILETAYLSEEELIKACKIASDAGVDFLKTSTGFAPRGASVADVEIMRKHAPTQVGIKASAGIRTRAQAEALIRAGPERLGTSAGVLLNT
jgi:deoxyribose-phosphate aldolase